MPNPDHAPRTAEIIQHVPALTILATGVQELGEVPFDSTVTAISYTPEAAITGAASPASRTLTVINKGQAGVGTAVLGTLAFLAGTNGVAFDEGVFTITGVAADKLLTKGDILVLSSAPVGGTGLVDPGGQIDVSIAGR